MKTLLKTFLSLLMMSVSPGAFAQDAEMADAFRSNGKIYVVLTIILVVLLGLILYLVSIDRKVTRIERKLPGNKA